MASRKRIRGSKSSSRYLALLSLRMRCVWGVFESVLQEFSVCFRECLGLFGSAHQCKRPLVTSLGQVQSRRARSSSGHDSSAARGRALAFAGAAAASLQPAPPGDVAKALPTSRILRRNCAAIAHDPQSCPLQRGFAPVLEQRMQSLTFSSILMSTPVQ